MFLSLALIFVLGTAARGQAQLVTSTWLGGESTATGDWSNSGFWDIAPQDGYNVTINTLMFPAIVTLNVDATVNQLSLGTGAVLAVGNGRNLRLDNSSTNQRRQ